MKYLLRIRFVFLILLILMVSSCNSDQEIKVDKDALQGTWMVTAAKLDEGFYRPYPQILEFEKDTLYYKNFEDEVRFKNSIRFTNDSIKLDSISFPIRKFYIKNGTLNFARLIANRILHAEEKLDIAKLDTLLSSSDWKIENKPGIYRFNSREKNFQWINADKTYSKYCYELVSFEGEVFLLKKGNQLACDRDYQFIEQVISYNNTGIETYGFSDGEFKTIRYLSVPKVNNIKPTDFQLCNKYLNKNYPPDRYYGKETEYNGGLYHVRKIFNEKYKVPHKNTESGIFQVRFVVNCQGKADMYETQAFDYDYKLKEFSSEIADQILEITKGLQDWIPGRRSKENQAIDTYIYLSFRIKDGKIIRIYP